MVMFLGPLKPGTGSEDIDSLITLGRECFKSKDWAGTLRYCEKVHEKDPNNGEAWALLGDLWYDMHRLVEAIRCYTNAIKNTADDKRKLELAKDSGFCLLDLKKYAEARDCFEIILKS